jgi:hypothetical protein
LDGEKQVDRAPEAAEERITAFGAEFFLGEDRHVVDPTGRGVMSIGVRGASVRAPMATPLLVEL